MNSRRIKVLLIQKFVTKLSNTGSRSEIRRKLIPDPGSSVQTGTGSRICNTGRTKKETLAWIPAATAAAQTASVRRLRTEWALTLVPASRWPPAQDNIRVELRVLM
jgi:hypothetical protein